MNKNIDLTKILENCPEGTKFYSPIFGEAIYSLEIQRSCFEVKPMNNKENIAFIYMRFKEDSK